MQGTGQQAAIRQQPLDLRQTEGHGHPARALDAMGALQPAHLLAQGGRHEIPAVVGGRGNKSMWGNDGHRPLDPVSGLGIEMFYFCSIRLLVKSQWMDKVIMLRNRYDIHNYEPTA
jgi:hypothetical protein